MSKFERYLTLWVALCIVVGIILGHFVPGVFHAIGAMQLAQVNLPVAVLIWLMIIPMLIKIDFGALAQVKEHWRGIGVTLFINWAVKPFSMAALGLALHRLSVPAVPSRRPDRQLHRRADSARCRSVHGNGVRLEQSVGWRAAFHTEPGCLERHHHGVRLRPDRWPVARALRDYRAMGDAAAIGRPVHRGAGHHCAGCCADECWSQAVPPR